MLIDELTERGVVDPSRLYESPFVELHGGGVDEMFGAAGAQCLIEALAQVRERAAA